MTFGFGQNANYQMVLELILGTMEVSHMVWLDFLMIFHQEWWAMLH
jgi:hypothetical protein